jgi:hypothetical protein
MARKKMSAQHRKAVGEVMRAARRRKPTGRKVHFTKDEKSTLRHVMTEHSHGGKRKAAGTRKRGKGRPGRKPGFRHSAATRKKMSKAHQLRKRYNTKLSSYRKGKHTRKNRTNMAWVRSHRKTTRRRATRR